MNVEAIEWLTKEGGPVIKWLTFRHFGIAASGYDEARLRKDLMECNMVKKWLQNLNDAQYIHGSFDNCLENAMGKLIEFGLDISFTPVDEAIKRRHERWHELAKENRLAKKFYLVLLGSLLLRMGIRDSEIETFTRQRLSDLTDFLEHTPKEFYMSDEEKQKNKVPKNVREKPFIKRELIRDGELMLPQIDDITAFSLLRKIDNSKITQKNIVKIINFVLSEVYQNLKPGFGYGFYGNKTYGIGWSCDLPGYFGFSAPDETSSHFIMRLELISQFDCAREHEWIKDCIGYLEQFGSNSGIYLFPRNMLCEKSGYYVSGAHMGLEETRRDKKTLQQESTFRMLRIITNINKIY